MDEEYFKNHAMWFTKVCNSHANLPCLVNMAHKLLLVSELLFFNNPKANGKIPLGFSREAG